MISTGMPKSVATRSPNDTSDYALANGIQRVNNTLYHRLIIIPQIGVNDIAHIFIININTEIELYSMHVL